MSKSPEFDSLNFPKLQFTRPAPPDESLPVWLAVILAGLALMNLFLLPMMETSGPDDVATCWGVFCMGSIGGQAGILAVAAVLGPGGTLWRHLFVVPAGVILMVAWLLGFVLSSTWYEHQYPTLKEITSVLLVVPLLFCVCELPLWFFRTLFQWRIESPSAVAARPPQLTISGILAATAAVALCLAAVRVGHKISDNSSEPGWWFGVGFAAAFCLGISLLVLPIATALVFRTEVLPIGLFVSAAWAGLLITIFLLAMSWRRGGFPTRELHLFFFLFAGFCATLLGLLALCRLFGYRLVWGKRI